MRLAAAQAKEEYATKKKRAWFKAENTPSCAVRASILGYDKCKKRQHLERSMREGAQKSRRQGRWVDHILQLLLGLIHLEVGAPSYEVDHDGEVAPIVTLSAKVGDELKVLVGTK